MSGSPNMKQNSGRENKYEIFSRSKLVYSAAFARLYFTLWQMESELALLITQVIFFFFCEKSPRRQSTHGRAANSSAVLLRRFLTLMTLDSVCFQTCDIAAAPHLSVLTRSHVSFCYHPLICMNAGTIKLGAAVTQSAFPSMAGAINLHQPIQTRLQLWEIDHTGDWSPRLFSTQISERTWWRMIAHNCSI